MKKRCPECNVFIDRLKVAKRAEGELTMMNKSICEFQNVQSWRYLMCPSCERILFNTIEEGIEFLGGNW